MGGKEGGWCGLARQARTGGSPTCQLDFHAQQAARFFFSQPGP